MLVALVEVPVVFWLNVGQTIPVPKLLLDSCSDPAKVARVPLVGKVSAVAPETVKVVP